jgi:hypothetical protein
LCYYLIMFTWAKQRQFYYLLGVFTFFAIIGLIIFLIYRPIPNCFDNKKNQDEVGIDCGGVCAKACAEQTQPLKIYWVRPLKVSDGWYDVVAQVENLNIGLGTRKLNYTFYLYDADNILITKRSGSTFVNSGEKFVIFESRVDVGVKEVKRAFLELSDQVVWEKVASLPKNIFLEKKSFVNEPKPVLDLLVSNDGLQMLKNIQVLAVLADANGNTFAASETMVDTLEPNSQQEAYFAWPTSFAEEPSFVDTYWRLNAFTLAN